MNTAVEFARRAFPVALLCGILVAGTGCPQSFGDSLDKIRRLHARNKYEEAPEGFRALRDDDHANHGLNCQFGKTMSHHGELSVAT